MAERIVAFAGSLRRGSFNRALIRAAQELAPEGMTIETIEIGELPTTVKRRLIRKAVHDLGHPP